MFTTPIWLIRFLLLLVTAVQLAMAINVQLDGGDPHWWLIVALVAQLLHVLLCEPWMTFWRQLDRRRPTP